MNAPTLKVLRSAAAIRWSRRTWQRRTPHWDLAHRPTGFGHIPCHIDEVETRGFHEVSDCAPGSLIGALPSGELGAVPPKDLIHACRCAHHRRFADQPDGAQGDVPGGPVNRSALLPGTPNCDLDSRGFGNYGSARVDLPITSSVLLLRAVGEHRTSDNTGECDQHASCAGHHDLPVDQDLPPREPQRPARLRVATVTLPSG